MVETELGEWRRTHYSKELDASMEGSDVTIMGWISSIRGHGNITFLTLVDKMGTIQVVTKKGECSTVWICFELDRLGFLPFL